MTPAPFQSDRNPADFHPLERADELIGKQLFTTAWVPVKRKHMMLFHDAIETNPEESDVSICLSNPLGDDIMDGAWVLAMTVNFHFNHNPIWSPGMWALFYGIEKARFPEPVFVGQTIRGLAHLADVRPHRHGRLMVFDNTVEIQGSDRPAMSATTTALFRIGEMPREKPAGL
jgi:acyl dehydratase